MPSRGSTHTRSNGLVTGSHKEGRVKDGGMTRSDWIHFLLHLLLKSNLTGHSAFFVKDEPLRRED
jgi:hypothetical protein